MLRSAAELDGARAETISVETLRAAALEAGISASAFDAAMMERDQPIVPMRRMQTANARRWIVRVTAIAVVILGLFAVLWMQPRESPSEISIVVPGSPGPR